MLSEDSIKEISHIFCGDTEGYYNYKSGSKLVSFFNEKFGYNDTYGQGFPSRWVYVYDRIVTLINKGRGDAFFSLILSKQYVLEDLKGTEVEAIEFANKVLIEFNRIIKSDMMIITKSSDKYYLREESDDLEYIGSGGFAIVYLQKSTGRVLKKLKEDYIGDKSIRSRFKREYNIMRELQEVETVIRVYDFDEGACTYTMEKAETTLEELVLVYNGGHEKFNRLKFQ